MNGQDDDRVGCLSLPLPVLVRGGTEGASIRAQPVTGYIGVFVAAEYGTSEVQMRPEQARDLARRLDRAAAIAEGSTRTTGEAMHPVPKPGRPTSALTGRAPRATQRPLYAAADLDAAGAVCEPDAEDRGRG